MKKFYIFTLVFSLTFPTKTSYQPGQPFESPTIQQPTPYEGATRIQINILKERLLLLRDSYNQTFIFTQGNPTSTNRILMDMLQTQNEIIALTESLLNTQTSELANLRTQINAGTEEEQRKRLFEEKLAEERINPSCFTHKRNFMDGCSGCQAYRDRESLRQRTFEETKRQKDAVPPCATHGRSYFRDCTDCARYRQKIQSLQLIG